MVLPLVIYLVVTLGVVGCALAANAYFFPEARQVRRRLAREFKDIDPDANSTRLFKRPEQLSLDDEPRTEVGALQTGAASRRAGPNASSTLADLLARANSTWKPTHLLLTAASLTLGLGLLGSWLGGLFLGGIAAAAGLLAPFLYVNQRARQRQEKYLRQLPAAFEMMARVIRAGQSVAQALHSVADAFEDPLAGAFAQCQMQVGLGIRPEVCFREMAQRSGLMEMRIFVMALLIQQKTGGNLSEVLDRLAAMIRARLKLRNQVRTLTAEGRLQGWTLVVLPFVVFAAMMVVNREYAETLLDNTSLLAITGCAMVVGILWIRKIVAFEY